MDESTDTIIRNIILQQWSSSGWFGGHSVQFCAGHGGAVDVDTDGGSVCGSVDIFR